MSKVLLKSALYIGLASVSLSFIIKRIYEAPSFMEGFLVSFGVAMLLSYSISQLKLRWCEH